MAVHGGDILFNFVANDEQVKSAFSRLDSVAKNVGSKFKSKFNNAFSSISGKAGSISSKISSNFGNAFKKVGKGAATAAAKVGKAFLKMGAVAAASVAYVTALITKKMFGAFMSIGKGAVQLGVKIGKTLAKGAAIGLAALSAGIIKLTKDTVNYGDEVDKNSQKMGMSAEGYQKWGYILDRCGASMENMKPAMKKLASAAATNDSAFQQLGISQQEVASLNQEQLFARTVQGLQQVEDTVQRTHIASQLLGKGAVELGAVFNMTSAETQALVQRLDYLGGTLSGPAVKNCAALKDAFTDLKMALRGIGNVIATYVVPILTSFINNIVIPAVVKIRQALESLFGKIPLFKKMREAFNKKTTKDIGGAASGLGRVADNAGKTGNNAKKAQKEVKSLKKELMGFDQITKLSGEQGTSGDTSTTGSTGTGAGAGDIGGIDEDDMGGYTPNVSTVTDNWWKEFKKAWNALDWGYLGKTAAEKLNSSIAKIDATSLGKGVAKVVNDVFDFAYNFTKTLDWDLIGKKIADFTNGFFKDVKWDLVGKSITEFVSGPLELLISAFRNTDWSQIAKSINTMIDNIDMKRLGKNFSDATHEIFNAANTLLKDIDWNGMGKKISDFIGSIDFKQLAKDASDLVKNGFNAIANFIDGIDFKVIGKKIGDFILNIDWLGIIKSIFNLIFSIMKAGDELFDGLLGVIIDKIKDWGGKIVDKIKDGFNKKKADLNKAWNNLTENVKDKVADMKAKVASTWNDLKDKWHSATNNVKDKVADMKAKVATTWSNLRDRWNSITNNVKDKTASMKAKVASKWSDLKNRWKSLMGNFQDKKVKITLDIASKINNVKSWINSHIIDRLNSVVPKTLKRMGFKIPRLAEGGYVKANTPQLAMIGDNTRHGEIVAPENKLQAMADAAANNNRGDTDMLLRQLIAIVQNLNLNVDLDGEKIKNNVVRRINNHTKSTGKLEILI